MMDVCGLTNNNRNKALEIQSTNQCNLWVEKKF